MNSEEQKDIEKMKIESEHTEKKTAPEWGTHTINEMNFGCGFTISIFVMSYILQIVEREEFGLLPWPSLIVAVISIVVLHAFVDILSGINRFRDCGPGIALLVGIVCAPILILLLVPAIFYIWGALK